MLIELLRDIIFPAIASVIGPLITRFVVNRRRIKEFSLREKVYKNISMKLFQKYITYSLRLEHHLLTSRSFREFIAYKANNLHDTLLFTNKPKLEPKKIETLINIREAITQTLGAICKITSTILDEDLSHFACTVMLPDKNKQALYINDYYPRYEYPRTFGQPTYGYKTSCAGYAWYQWKEGGGERFFVLPNVPEHIRKYPREGNPERKFEIKYDGQEEKYKSIISLVLYHQFRQHRLMLGVLNITSDIEDLFTSEKYRYKLQPPLASSYQTLVFCYLIDQIKEKYLSSSV